MFISNDKLTLGSYVTLIESMAGRLFVYDLERNNVRTVKLRQARPDCKTCSPANRITPADVKKADYVIFCGAPAHDMASNRSFTNGIFV